MEQTISVTARWGPGDDHNRDYLVDRVPCVGEFMWVDINDELEGGFQHVTEVRWYGRRIYGDNPIPTRAWIYLNGAEVHDRVGMPKLSKEQRLRDIGL